MHNIYSYYWGLTLRYWLNLYDTNIPFGQYSPDITGNIAAKRVPAKLAPIPGISPTKKPNAADPPTATKLVWNEFNHKSKPFLYIFSSDLPDAFVIFSANDFISSVISILFILADSIAISSDICNENPSSVTFFILLETIILFNKFI